MLFPSPIIFTMQLKHVESRLMVLGHRRHVFTCRNTFKWTLIRNNMSLRGLQWPFAEHDCYRDVVSPQLMPGKSPGIYWSSCSFTIDVKVQLHSRSCRNGSTARSLTALRWCSESQVSARVSPNFFFLLLITKSKQGTKMLQVFFRSFTVLGWFVFGVK